MPEILTASEHEDVLAWRLHVLLGVGCPIPVAERLAASDVDLHRAVELIQQGCPPETAVRILI